ncbi:MAG: presenilin family intramembrane aspartyl protease [Candidatus Marsarchaeota archaeon]|nr:presenilin family intramembrane aspartyl protease [Candidatus Marsarchaeota archaeon]
MSSSIHSFFSEPLHYILLLFVLTQLLGVACGLLLFGSSATNPDVQSIAITPTGQADDWLNAVVFIAYVVFGAGVALLVIRFLKRKIAFRALEFFMLTGSVSVVFLALLMGLLGMGFLPALAASGALGFAFSILKFFTPALKNTAAVLSSAGVAALFGFSLGFWPAVLFVLGLSLYDYIAVFKTRHMLQLAQHLGERDLAFTITAENKEKEKKEKIVAPLSSASASSSKSVLPLPASAPSSIDRLDLGSGDLAVPAMLAVSTSTIAGAPGALAVALGCSVALYLTLKLVIEKRVALPALPPLCLGGLGALLIFLLARDLLGV